MKQLEPNLVLNKAYRQFDFDLFINSLRTLLDNANEEQREETLKERLRDFLSETFYKSYFMAPEKDIDFTIRLE